MPLAFGQHCFNVDAIWSAPCIDVHMIIQRSLLSKTICRFTLFPFFHFLFFPFLFNLFCFSSLCQRVVLLTLLDTKENPNCLLFSQREREREREREGGRVVRWCLVNFQCRGVLLIWIIVGQRPIALAVDADGGCLAIFSLVYLSLFGRRPNID